MKILQLHTNKHGLQSDNGYPKGGLEKVVIDIKHALDNAKIDNYVIDSPDSTLGVMDDTVINMSLEQKDYYKNKHIILTWIENNQPDHIIVHGSNKLLKFLTEHNIACLFVDHQQHISINKLYHMSLFNDVVPKARKVGSLIYSVSSESCITKANKINEQGLTDYEFSFDGWMNFQFITNELREIEVKPSNGKLCTIGRSAPDKAPHKIINFASKTKTPFDIIVMVKIDKDEDYYKNKLKPVEDNVSRNISRKETLNILSEAGLYVSTCPSESAGITAFESLCLGVPIVLFESSKYRHASRMYMPEGSKYVVSIKEDYSHLINLSLKERQKIREICIEHNSEEKFLNTLISRLEGIDTYGKREKGLFDYT